MTILTILDKNARADLRATCQYSETNIALDNLENVLAVLLRVVNGATRTQGQFSNGEDFAHIPQAVLDVGRATLAAYGVDPAKINARD